MNMQWIYWNLRYWIGSSPWGALFFVIVVFLAGGAILGAVDFRKKKRQAELDLEDGPEDRLATLQSVREHLQNQVDGEFRVDHFDGAFQIFTTPNLPLSNEQLYHKVRLRFPSLVFAIHRSLQPESETQPAND